MVQGVTISDNAIQNVNPATGELISTVPCSSPEEITTLVFAAAEAQKQWEMTPVKDRIDLLRRGLELLEKEQLRPNSDKNISPLAKLIVQEMGKPLAEAVEEIEGSVDKKGAYLDILEESLQPKRHGNCVVVRQALGVVAISSPWNFPCDEILLLALPSLGAGNCVIVKPSEVVPETGRVTVETLARVLPKGVIQLAQGDGRVGAQLMAHPMIKLVAMTGSSATGKKILEATAPQLKRVVLELGGKDPMVVFADSHLEKAAEDAVRYSLSNTGQVCCSIERIFVEQSIYDSFVSLVKVEAVKYNVGNGLDENVQIGPLVSPMQRDHVQRHVQDAVDKGAELVYQSPLPNTENNGSSFYPVTVLSKVQDGMLMYREETFGPVVALTPFSGTEEDAIRLANDTDYGLAGAVYTSDTAKGTRVASKIEAGQVGINCYTLDHMTVQCPWVGHKESGLGYHSGVEGFGHFSIPKSLVYLQDDRTTEA